MGVVEDVGDVEHFRKHLDAVVDVEEAGDEHRDPPADVFTRWSSASRSPHGSGGPTFEDSAFHSSAGLIDLSALKSTRVISRAISMSSTRASSVPVMCSSG